MALPDIIQSAAGVITAVFTAVIAGATIWFVRSTARMARITVQADLLERLITRWDSAMMCKRRAALARSLQERSPNGGLDGIPGSQIEGVVDFFEQVGTYFAKKLIDEELTWETFFDHATLYWITCGKQFSAKIRSGEDQTKYDRFEGMVARMEEMYHQKTSVKPGKPIYTNDEINDFLRDEQQREPGAG